jgi:hypothetical protein
MPALSEYANVSATAFEVLRAKGFQVWVDESMKMYCAERDGWDFLADSPCGLLGVVAIFEHVKPTEFKDYWWRLARDPEVPKQPIPYTSVIYAGHGKQPGRHSTE